MTHSNGVTMDKLISSTEISSSSKYSTEMTHYLEHCAACQRGHIRRSILLYYLLYWASREGSSLTAIALPPGIYGRLD